MYYFLGIDISTTASKAVAGVIILSAVVASYSVLQDSFSLFKKIDRKSIFVFIGGASGSGKTTLAELLEAKFIEQGKSCATIKMDDYFREIPANMDLVKYQNETIFDTPAMLCLEELRKHLLNLSKGNTIAKPIFNFSTSRRNGTKDIAPADIIIVEGIFALAFVQKWLSSTGLITLTVNVETSSYLEIIKRRIQRNTRDYHQDKNWLIQQEKKSVGPGFFKHTATGALAADISLLNDTTTQENGAIDLDALNSGVNDIINQLSHINKSTVPSARKPPADFKQMVINSHSELIFRK
jgi:uridine kinase